MTPESHALFSGMASRLVSNMPASSPFQQKKKKREKTATRSRLLNAKNSSLPNRKTPQTSLPRRIK